MCRSVFADLNIFGDVNTDVTCCSDLAQTDSEHFVLFAFQQSSAYSFNIKEVFMNIFPGRIHAFFSFSCQVRHLPHIFLQHFPVFIFRLAFPIFFLFRSSWEK